MQTKVRNFFLTILLVGVVGFLIILFVTPVLAQTATPQNSSSTATPNPIITPTIQPTPAVQPSPAVQPTPPTQPPSALEIVNTIATIATPLMVLILTGLGWSIRNRADRARELEEKLREDRIQIYNDILEPFIMLFTKGNPTTKNQRNKSYKDLGAEKVMSLEYKQAAFKLSLIGSDDVLRSYNDLMQFFYEVGNDPEGNQTASPMDMLSLFGKLLLEIRKSVGNESTDLNNFEMLEFLITDLRKFQKNGRYPSS